MAKTRSVRSKSFQNVPERAAWALRETLLGLLE
jgi:hypothetical protein